MTQKTLLIESTSSDGTAEIEEKLSSGAIEISSINDTFDLMSSLEIHHFFLKVSSLVSETASQLCDDQDSVCDIADESEQRGVLIKAGCVSLLRKIAAIILKRMESTKDSHSSMLGAVEVLHDLLIPLDDAVPGALSLKVTIARICEKWWISESDGAENLVTQLLPYLLIAGLSPTAHDSDVKRLYTIRTTLQLLDFDDDSIESIRSLLLRCFISPAFLRVPDGKRFLSYLFSVHEGR
jgi:hypothetical protein